MADGQDPGTVEAEGTTVAPDTDVPAGEPTAEPPTEAPLEEAPVGGTPVEEPVPEEDPLPTLPSHEDFDWDVWDYSSDALPEEVRGWAGSILNRLDSRHQEALAAERDKAEQAERLWEAMANGAPDPRLAEAEAQVLEIQKKLDAQQEALEAQQKYVEQVVDKQTDRYINWFAHEHSDVVQDETRFNAMADLSEKLDLEWHETLELQALGSKAVEETLERKQKGKSAKDALELMRFKYPAGTKEKKDRTKDASERLAASDDRPLPAAKTAPAGKPGNDLSSEGILAAVRSVTQRQRKTRR